MASPIEDFIVSLGFDTSKVQKQVGDLQSMLNKLAVKTDKQREQSGLKVQKTLKDDAIKNHNLVEKALQKNQDKQLKREEDLYKLQLAKNKAIDDQNRKLKQSSSFIESAKRQQAVRALLYPEANPQLKAMGSYYKKLQSDQSALGIANQRLRSRRAVGTLTNLQAFRDLKESGPEGRKQALESLLAARMAAKGGKLDKIKTIRSEVIKLNRSLQETGKIVNTRPTSTGILGTINAITNAGGFKGYTEAQRDRLLAGAQKQDTQKGADAFIRVARDIERYRGIGGGKIDRAISSGNIDNLRTTYKELGRMNAELERTRRASIGAAAAMSSLHDSTRNMVREYASLYAILAGTNAINQTGQQFEALNSAMLAATGNTAEAANQMQFMIDLSKRLGLNVKDITDQYIKFKFAAKDKLSTKQTEELFTNMSELGTVLGLSQEKMKLSFNAITQMMNKTKVSSEELKNQMAESFPGAIQIFSKALGKTEAQMFEMMGPNGAGVLAADILPKVSKVMHEMARAGGALDAKLQSVRVTQGQFNTALQLGQNIIFGNGYNTGLANLFKTMTDEINENGETLKRVGRIYEKVFNGLASVVQVVSKWLEVFIRSIESVYIAVKNNPFTTMLVSVTALIGAFKMMPALLQTVGKVLVSVLTRPLAILTALMAAIDEIRAIFDANVIGIGENDKASQKSRDIAAANYRVRAGFGTEADKKMLQGLTPEQIKNAQNESGGLGAWLFGSTEDGAAKVERIRKEIPQTAGFMDGYLKMLQSPANLFGSAKDLMFNQTVIIQGDVSDEQIRRIGEESKKAMDRYSSLQSVGAR